MDVDFIAQFIREQVEGTGPVSVRNLTYRDGGVEISPGSIVPCIIPEWLKDQTVEITLTGGSGTITSAFGTVDLKATIEPSTHSVTGTLGEVSGSGSLTDTDTTHKITLTFGGRLKDGDTVTVAKFSGLKKYVILAKVGGGNA